MRIHVLKKTEKIMYTMTPETNHFLKNNAGIVEFRTRVNYLLVNPIRVLYGNFKDPNFAPKRTILMMILLIYSLSLTQFPGNKNLYLSAFSKR